MTEKNGTVEEKVDEKDEKPLEQPPIEDSETPSMSEESSTQTVTPQQLQDYILNRLLEGGSYREISKETGLGKSTIQKYFPKSYIDNLRVSLQKQVQERENTLLQQQEREFLQPQARPTARNMPSAHVIVPLQWLTDYESTLPAAQRRVHEQMRGNIIRYNEQLDREAKQYQSKGSSNPSTYGGSGYDQLCRELAESEKVERLVRLRQGLRGRSGVDGLDNMLKMFQLGLNTAPKATSVDGIAIYRSGRSDQKSDLGRAGDSNVIDLKIEELRQSHDLGMEKIRWEQKLAFMKMEGDKDKWEKISETFGPILQSATPEIRNAIRLAGESVGRSMGGNPNPPVKSNMESVICPKCNASLNIPIPKNTKGDVQAKCPGCGNLFLMTQEAESPKRTVERAKFKPQSNGSRIGGHYT